MTIIVAYSKQAANNGYIYDDLFDLCEGDGHVRRKDDGYIARTQKDAEDGAARKEETEKAYNEVYGCSER